MEFLPLRVGVLVISDTRTLDTDRSGAWIAERLQTEGHELVGREIVPDTPARIAAAARRMIGVGADDLRVDVLITTGGTGVTRRDVTPEALTPLVTKAIPGFGELFRWLSYEDIGASTIQSRAFGALCGRALVFALPGSLGACRLALDKILVPQLDGRTRPCNFAELLPRMRDA